MLKSVVVVALIAACSASQLSPPRPAMAARSQESVALRLRGGNSVVTAPSQTKVLRGGGAKPLFMGMDVQLFSYFAGWSVPAAHPPSLRTFALAHPTLPHHHRCNCQVPAQLLLLD